MIAAEAQPGFFHCGLFWRRMAELHRLAAVFGPGMARKGKEAMLRFRELGEAPVINDIRAPGGTLAAAPERIALELPAGGSGISFRLESKG